MIKHIHIKGNNKRDKKGILQQFLFEAQKYKPLTFEEERTATREQLINHNMLFAVSVAFRYDNSQCDIMDLISEAMIGLIKAADTFNRDYENKFISYAMFQIQRHIKEFIDMRKTPVKIPHKILQIKYNIGKHQETDTPTLAAKLNVKEHLIDTAQSITEFVSLDDVDEDGDNIYQVASDEQTDKHVLRIEQQELLSEIFECLTDRESEVLSMRYLGNFPKDLTAVSESMKVCRERIRQIEKQAFHKIRNKYANGI